MKSQNADGHSSHRNGSRIQQRPLLILLFAIILATIASWTSAGEPNIVYRASVSPPIDHAYPADKAETSDLATTSDLENSTNCCGHVALTRLDAVIPLPHGGANSSPSTRPQYVEFKVGLANFDADAEPDGWRAEVVLRDKQDRPVKMRAQAKFELMPLTETLSEHRYESSYSSPIRWTRDLEFDEQGIARMKLPLRQQLKPALGWNDSDVSLAARSRDHRFQRQQNRLYRRSRSFVTVDVRETIGNPNLGEMRVRVSVPTEGVFSAKAPVAIRPAVLVDTHWPYR